MMSATPENLAQNKKKLAVAVMRYNKLRGKVPHGKFAVVEGDDDSVFYSVLLNRVGFKALEMFFVANGKDNVLGLRNHVLKSKEIPKGDGNIYFVDKDFDGLKNSPAGNDLYVTPTYSLENILVSKTALRCILLAEFKLGDFDAIDDLEKILCLFDNFLLQHEKELNEVNRIIHFVRQRSRLGDQLTSGSINKNCEKFADLKFVDLSINKVASGSELLSLICVAGSLDEAQFDALKAEFDGLNSSKDWRGKFLFYLFRRFVKFLVEDRNCKNPRFFTKGGGNIALDTSSTSFIRTLASVCDIPSCFDAFMKQAMPIET